MVEVNWRDLPPLATLRAFEATARLQGYSAAARALNVTPAAIAQQVRKLEDAVGTALVKRAGRGLTLTAAGRQLAVPLREAFGLMASGFDDLRRAQAQQGVRVSTTQFFVDGVLLPRLGDFWARNPEVQVAFSPHAQNEPVDMAAFDIIVCGERAATVPPGYVVQSLLHTPIIICAAPGITDPQKPDLNGTPWIMERSIDSAEMGGFIRRAGADPEAVRYVDPGAATYEIEAAVMGYGLTVATEIVVRRQLAAGTLVKLDTALDAWTEYTVTVPRGRLAPPVLAFLDWLIEICAPLSAVPAKP